MNSTTDKKVTTYTFSILSPSIMNGICAMLVRRLGGTVTITRKELEEAVESIPADEHLLVDFVDNTCITVRSGTQEEAFAVLLSAAVESMALGENGEGDASGAAPKKTPTFLN